MSTYKSMLGKKGYLTVSDGELWFREYFENGEFEDYRVQNAELEVRIIDTDAYLYNEDFIDHSKETLGR